jgi:hypothetical protein
VGHNGLKDGSHIKYDEEAEIEIYLSEPVYQEYILQQTYFLLKEGCHYDIDHIIFKSKIEEDRLNLLISELRKKGVLIFQEDYFLGDNIRRFVLIEFDFFNSIPFFSNDSIENSPIKKIKFVVQKNKNEIYFSPLIFPIWKYKDKFLNNNEFSNIPFKLPFNIPENLAKVNKFLIRRIYDNIRLTYTICLAKSFFQEFIFDQKHVSGYDLVRNDLDAVYGEEISDQIIRSTKGFIADNNIFDFTRITHNKSKKYQIEKK